MDGEEKGGPMLPGGTLFLLKGLEGKLK